MNKIIFLGTGAAASVTRQMTSLLFVTDKVNFLIDCGDGMGTVRNIIKSGIDINSISDIFLTHRHADHIIGLTHLLYIRLIKNEKAKVRVLGPKQTLGIARKICFETHDYLKIHKHRIAFIEIKEHEKVKLSYSVLIEPIKVKGPSKYPLITYGYQMLINNKKVTFSADMVPSLNFEKKAMNSDILIHECFCLNKEKEGVSGFGHTSAREAGETARKCNVKHLILTHFRDEPDVYANDLVNEARMYFSGKIRAAFDLMKIDISQ